MMVAEMSQREKVLRHLAITTDRRVQDILLDRLNRIDQGERDAAQEGR